MKTQENFIYRTFVADEGSAILFTFADDIEHIFHLGLITFFKWSFLQRVIDK